MKQATLNLEPPAATTRPLRVTQPATETACAAAPALDASASAVDRAGSGTNAGRAVPVSNGGSPCAEESADDPPAKALAGPRSKAARICALARALGVQSDAEAAGQLGDVPF